MRFKRGGTDALKRFGWWRGDRGWGRLVRDGYSNPSTSPCTVLSWHTLDPLIVHVMKCVPLCKHTVHVCACICPAASCQCVALHPAKAKPNYRRTATDLAGMLTITEEAAGRGSLGKVTAGRELHKSGPQGQGRRGGAGDTLFQDRLLSLFIIVEVSTRRRNLQLTACIDASGRELLKTPHPTHALLHPTHALLHPTHDLLHPTHNLLHPTHALQTWTMYIVVQKNPTTQSHNCIFLVSTSQHHSHTYLQQWYIQYGQSDTESMQLVTGIDSSCESFPGCQAETLCARVCVMCECV